MGPALPLCDLGASRATDTGTRGPQHATSGAHDAEGVGGDRTVPIVRQCYDLHLSLPQAQALEQYGRR